MSFFSAIGSFIMTPLYYAVSFVMVQFHDGLIWLGMDGESGLSWVLSVIGLTVVIRALLIPLFVKQIKSSRNMALIQPKVKELQKKYGHDRERLAQETMKLYRESKTNPFASCLPILLQMPIFFALFRMIDQASRGRGGRGVLSDLQADQIRNAELFGVPISQTFIGAGGNVGVMVMAAVLVLAMTATTFLTQRQLMSKNMPPDALTGPYAQQQKLLLYVLPVVFAVGGVAFPIAVLVYWTTSNMWTMGQQFYVIRNNPAPNTAAAEAKEQRDRVKAHKKGLKTPAELAEEEARRAAEEAAANRPPRQQPKKQPRSQRSGAPKQPPKQSQTPAKKPKKKK